MGNIKEMLKWLLVGILLALLLAGVVYISLPSVDSFESNPVATDESNYSATIYSAPEIELDHYRLSEDKYFDYLVSGVANVGREDPSKYPLWISEILEEHIKQELFRLVEENLQYDEEGNFDYSATLDEVLAALAEEDAIDADVFTFLSTYQARTGEEFPLSLIMSLREAEEDLFNPEENEDGLEGSVQDEVEEVEEDVEESEDVDTEEGTGESTESDVNEYGEDPELIEDGNIEDNQEEVELGNSTEEDIE